MTEIALNVVDAAKAIGISRSRLYELIATGEVEARKIGSRTVIPTASLHRLLNNSPRCEASYTNAKARAASSRGL